MWLGELDLRDLGEVESPDAPNADERMLDLIVLSEKSGWTPKEVMLWIFPIFLCLMFDLIRDVCGTT